MYTYLCLHAGVGTDFQSWSRSQPLKSAVLFTGCLLVVGQATMLKLTALSAPPCCNSSNMLSCPLQPLLTVSVCITAEGWTALKCLAESKSLWLILLQNSWWNMSHHKTLDATLCTAKVKNSLNIFHLQTEPKTMSCSVQRAGQDPETAFWHVYQLTWSGQTRRKARANPKFTVKYAGSLEHSVWQSKWSTGDDDDVSLQSVSPPIKLL